MYQTLLGLGQQLKGNEVCQGHKFGGNLTKKWWLATDAFSGRTAEVGPVGAGFWLLGRLSGFILGI